MIGKNRRKLITASAVIAAGSMLLAAAPAQALEQGITTSSIKLGITIPMTGIASPGYSKIPGAMKAYFDYVNANGGVNGRKITLVVKDDQYIPTLAVAKANELIFKDKVFALIGTLGTASTKAISRSLQLSARGIPSLFVNTGYSGFADKKLYPTSFSILPSYQMEAKVIGKYLDENFAGKKVGLIYQDDDFGVDALNGFKQAGVDFAVKIPYASGSQGVAGVAGTWITKLQAAAPDVVVLFGVSSATAAALGNAYAYKYAPKWILGSVGGDATTLTANKVPAAFLAGSKGLSFAPAPSDSTDPYIAMFMDVNEKYNKNAPFDNNIVAGMTSAFLAVQAIKAAGPNLTRKSLIAAIEKSSATFANPALTPLGFSSTSHVGATGYWIGTYDATGSLKPDGGKYTVYTTDSGTGAVVVSTY
ncbi:MAG: ABC transporter substrate-binding protein, partial [Actinobacteria bacterium]|nr:ABC transporter substrate-binding protein [Actinomycetota bacterium]